MKKLPAPVITIPWDVKGIFRQRPNRFLAHADAPSRNLTDVKAHVHDPGRLREILYPGNEILLRHNPGKKRKTSWDVIAGRV